MFSHYMEEVLKECNGGKRLNKQELFTLVVFQITRKHTIYPNILPLIHPTIVIATHYTMWREEWET